ncbi:MAG: thermostable hemolysin [Novosphingobium sp.]|nr:thermostable hemolysin [Novosphingobium sp.]
MPENVQTSLICRRYRDVFGAALTPSFDRYIGCDREGLSDAALGYCRAGEAPLFLECYLDRPVEDLVSAAFGRAVARGQIVEIGNFAADNAMAMVELWGAVANDLGAAGEVAVATLTAPLRRMFARIGVPITILGAARPERLGPDGGEWGRYYEFDPQVCAGIIADGQRAIAAFMERRQRREAA